MLDLGEKFLRKVKKIQKTVKNSNICESRGPEILAYKNWAKPLMQGSFAQPILSIETKISDLGEQFSRKTVDIGLKKKNRLLFRY